MGRHNQTKADFFYHPSSKREMFGSRTVIHAMRHTLLDAVAQCAADDTKAVLIDEPLLPPIEAQEEWELQIEPWRLFLKYGKEVNLRVPLGIQKALAQKASEVKLRRERFAELDEARDYCGLVWTGIRTRAKHKIHLVDAIEGEKLYVFARAAPASSIDHVVVEAYSDTKAAPLQGAFYIVTVPSRSQDEPYQFRLQSVPLPNHASRYAIWTDENAFGHGCKENLYYFSYRRKTGEFVFCPHMLAVHMAVAKYEKEKKKRGFMDMPGPLATKFFVEDVYNILRARVRMVETAVVDGRTRTTTRPLNKAEVEMMLWGAVARYGHDKTCFINTDPTKGPVDPKMQEYRWSLREYVR